MIKKLKNYLFYFIRGIETFVSYWSGYLIPPKPSVMYLEMTYCCTCRCGFCERWKVGPKLAKNELTTAQWKRFLTQARRLGVKNIGFTGGEPLLKKDIFQIARFAKKLGFNITLATNGTLVNQKNAKKIAAIFDSVAISMDGTNAQTHDAIRGVRGVYNLATNAIRLLKEEGITVTVNLVITQKNFMEIDEYIKFFSQRRIPLQLTPVHEYEKNEFKVKKALKRIDLKKFRQEWYRLSRKHKFLNCGYYRQVPTFLSQPHRLRRAYTCFAASASFFVNPYGEVFPCEFLRTPLGDLKKESLASIWKKAQKIRKYISSSERSCICWSHCVVPLNDRLTRFIALKKGVR